MNGRNVAGIGIGKLMPFRYVFRDSEADFSRQAPIPNDKRKKGPATAGPSEIEG